MVAIAKKRNVKPSWQIVEDTFFGLAPADPALGVRVDRENGVIRGVKIVGVQSRNIARVIGCLPDQFGDAADKPYSYDAEGLKAAVGLYEGKSVFSNHRPYRIDELGRRVIESSERDNLKLVGWIENATWVDGPPEVAGIYGDFHVLKSSDLADVLFEAAERKPDRFALSHEAFSLEPTVQRGEIVLPGIARVDAIALVSGVPGTTQGLFESSTEETMPKKFRELFAALPASHKGARVVMEMMDAPVGAPIANADAPEGADADALTKQAFRAMVMAAFDDDSLDSKATVARIKEILAAQDKLSGKSDTTTEVDPPPQVDESAIATKAQGVVFECLGMLTEAKVLAPSREVIEAMTLLPSDRRKAYATEIGRTQTVAAAAAGPRSADPAGGSASPAPGGEIKTFDDFKKAIA